MDLNKVQLIGRLTRDPEIRSLPSGGSVASLSLATSFSWKDKEGQRQEKTEFHNIVAWRKLAEICGQYLRKGSKVYFEGRLTTRSWTDQAGVKKYRTEVVVDNMIMLDSRGAAAPAAATDTTEPSATPTTSEAPAPATPAEPSAPATPAAPEAEEEVNIEDIPF